MATISIVVVDPNNGTKTGFNVPDDIKANQLVPALINHFKLSPQSNNPYRLVRVQNGSILEDNDTMGGISSAANETFVLLTKKQITQELERDNLFHIPSLWKIILNLVAGVFFIMFSFPDGVRKSGDALGWSLVRDTGIIAKSIITSLFGASPNMQNASFNNLWSGLVIALFVYLGALALLSLRHQRFDLVGSGFLSLIVGTSLLHLLAWIVYIVIVVIVWIFQMLGFLFALLGSFFAFIFPPIASFLVFIFVSSWWLIALLVVGGGVFLAVKFGAEIFEFAKEILIGCGIPVFIVGIVIGVFYLLSPFLAPIFAFIGQIFAFIGQIVGVIIRFLVILLIGLIGGFLVHWFGSLLIDQFKGAWKAGNETRGVILGAIAIGTSLALVLLESNLYNLDYWFPSGFPDFIIHHLHQSTPIFDIIITLLVVSVSIIAILRNLPKLRREPGWREFGLVVATAAPLLLVGVGLIAAQGYTEDS